MVQAYSVYETKSRLSEILRIVKSGKEVVVSERGHSIARILPFKEPDTLKDRMDWLSSIGQIIKPESTERDFSTKCLSEGALTRFLEERE